MTHTSIHTSTHSRGSSCSAVVSAYGVLVLLAKPALGVERDTARRPEHVFVGVVSERACLDMVVWCQCHHKHTVICFVIIALCKCCAIEKLRKPLPRWLIASPRQHSATSGDMHRPVSRVHDAFITPARARVVSRTCGCCRALLPISTTPSHMQPFS